MMKSRSFFWGCVLLLSLSGPAYAAGGNWVETSSWFGRGPMTTRVIDVVGDRWRVHYINHGPGSLQIRIYNPDHERVFEIFTRGDQSRIRNIPVEPGRYYLVIEPEDSRWEVQVRQRISRTQEWFLRQETEKFHAGLERFASFSGGEGQVQYPISIPYRSWRMVYTNSQRGRLQLRLIDTRHGYSFSRILNRPERTHTWIHQSGDFVLQIDAADTRWRVDFYHE